MNNIVLEVESTTESTDISNNGHRGEPDQNSNVVQKINTEIEEKEKLVMLQVYC